MNVTSLGYRTDLALRVLEGSEIDERDGYLVIRTRANPAFRWGNFLLLRDPPKPDAADHWTGLFRKEFPGTNYVALGIDVRSGDDAADGFPGFDRQVNEVLTAQDLSLPERPNWDATYRPLRTDVDWQRAARLAYACNDGGQDMRDFLHRRLVAKRQVAEAGHGSWFGAFLDGELLAQLGVFRTDTGLARFQDVETHPDARRQGLAGTLVCHAAGYAFQQLAARTLVMVADPAGDAIRLYRSLGFAEGERQVGLEHLSS